MHTQEIDGEELLVDDELKVTQYHRVTDGSLSTDTEFVDAPDAVTEGVAEWVWDEFLIDVEDRGIKVAPPLDV